MAGEEMVMGLSCGWATGATKCKDWKVEESDTYLPG